LKLNVVNSNLKKIFKVEEVLPVKQGLKLKKEPKKERRPIVEEVLPVKQGLKLFLFFLNLYTSLLWRGTSSKTRIETIPSIIEPTPLMSWRGTSSKTRIETLMNMLSAQAGNGVEEVLQ